MPIFIALLFAGCLFAQHSQDMPAQGEATLPPAGVITATSLPVFRLAVEGGSAVFLPNSAFHCHTPVMPNEPSEPKVDGPDSPMVSFRDAAGLIHVFVAGGFNFALTGTSFQSLTQNCSSVYLPHWNSTPADFQYAEWLRSPYSIDGLHVYGVVHNEYHCGTANPSMNKSCVYEALTQVHSTDGGKSFVDETMPQRLLATIPYNTIPTSTTGVGDNSNIIKNPSDGYYYMQAIEHSNGVGPCMLRSSDLSNWYAWNGTSFSLPMNNPVGDGTQPKYSCAPIFKYPLDGVGNIRYVSQYGLFLGVGSLANSIYYTVSKDLVVWSAPVFLFPPNSFVSLGGWQTGDALPVAYAALFDPDSTASNFDVVNSGDRLYLSLIRTHTYINSNGVAALDNSNRDVITFPLALSSSVAPSPAAPPTFSLPPGSYKKAQTITLACSNPSAVIYYSTSPSSPPVASPSVSTQYAGSVIVAKSETIQAICAASDYGISPISTAKYTISGGTD
jgi:hypothetical protein